MRATCIGDIQQAAREKANIELTLGGDIGWSLFPWLGIELKDVGIAPVGAPDQSLAQVGNMGLGVEVLPLLRRQVRIEGRVEEVSAAEADEIVAILVPQIKKFLNEAQA